MLKLLRLGYPSRRDTGAQRDSARGGPYDHRGLDIGRSDTANSADRGGGAYMVNIATLTAAKLTIAAIRLSDSDCTAHLPSLLLTSESA